MNESTSPIVPIRRFNENSNDYLSLSDHRSNVYKFQQEHCMSEGMRDIHVPKESECLWKWNKTHYRKLFKLEAEKMCEDFMSSKKRFPTMNDPQDKNYEPNSARIKEFLGCLKRNCTIDNQIDSGNSWLFPMEPMSDPSMIIPFKNGLFDFSKYLIDGQMKDCMMHHTPRFFNSWVIPYDLNVHLENGRRPVLFLEALGKIFNEDPYSGTHDSIDLLFEYLGYAMTDLATHHKMLLLIGESGSGKSTIQRIFQKVVGFENCVNPSVATLYRQFGMSQWLHKRLAIFGDFYIPKTYQKEIEESILKVTGGDLFTVEKKIINETVQSKIYAKIVIASNKTPNFKSSKEAFSRRCLFLYFDKKADQDPNFESTIEKEIPLIFIEAIQGLRRLIKRGKIGFIQPKSSEFLALRMQRGQSSLAAFVNEKCILSPSLETPKAFLSNEYANWCLENDEEMEEGHFKTNLLDMFGNKVKESRPGTEDRVYMYKGIGLKKEQK